MTLAAVGFDVVVPTVGRDSLPALLEAVTTGPGPGPDRVVVVDDRRRQGPAPLVPGRLPAGVTVVRGPGRGPAAARNAGWRLGSAEWVAFLDDDVLPPEGWREALAADLAGLGEEVGASQGRIVVPLPAHRRPTDWERNVAGLRSARWATADMAYRRAALAAVGGFDERFPRAYREDADLGARVVAAGWRIVRGQRSTTHPVRPADRWVSVRLQAGNADDALLRVVHGRRWRELTGVPAGRRRRHAAVCAAGAAALAAGLRRRPRHLLAGAAAAAWAAGTAELAWARIGPGPRTADEIATMVLTSVAIPPAAMGHWLGGWARLPLLARRRQPAGPAGLPVQAPATRPATGPATRPAAGPAAEAVNVPAGEAVKVPAAVLFDRDGTLVVDVPYNGDPDLVVPMPGAREALDRLREAGIPTAVVSNQSGVARGLITGDQVAAVNRRVEELLGPLGPWQVCPHGEGDGCGCRKPAAGLVVAAARALGVEPSDVAVVGDIGADVAAARAAGARAVLVPTAATRPEEVAAAPEVAPDLPAAVELLVGGRP